MKLHIENINITLHQQLPAGLIAALAIAGAAKPASKVNVPSIGEKWPGLDAIYAGVALSKDEDRLVHLILYTDDPRNGMPYEKAVEYAEGVNPEMDSHIPTRHQSIALFERLRDQFDNDCVHWTLTKRKDGNTAFCQHFNYGSQIINNLSSVCRVRAVSRFIHLLVRVAASCLFGLS